MSRAAPALSLDLFAPQRVAIVGASERPGPAADLQRTLSGFGFSGEIFPVNPNRASVFDRPAFPSVSAIPGGVDLAILVVAPDRVLPVIEDAAACRTPLAVIYTAGFAELGGEGLELQRQMQAAAAASGMRLLGPNCIGFINPRDHVAAFVAPPASLPAGTRPGGAALVSQSGGLMISVIEYASQVGLGFGLLLSTGNEADITSLDALEAIIDDDDLRVIGLIVEGIQDGRRLVALGHRAGRLGKRIVALKLGRSARGAKAVLSHTAVLAGSQRVFDAACASAGIVQVRTIAQLVDHLVLLEKARPAPAPRRRRGRRPTGVAAITISGATKVLLADLAADSGLTLAELSPRTKRAITQVIPNIGIADNPLDVTARAIEDGDVLRQCVRSLAADPAVDAIALVLHLKKSGGSESLRRLVRAFCELQAELPARLVVISSIPEGVSGYWQELAISGSVPFLNDLADFAALKALDPPPASPTPAVRALRSAPPEIRAALARGDRVLAEADCRALLERAGLPVVPGQLAGTAAMAGDAADRLGYPVALKVSARGLAHKTEVGGIRLGLQARADVERAFQDILDSVGAAAPVVVPDGVLVERMASPGVELIVGLSTDPQFGPVVTVGLGGIQTEVLDDVAVRLGPVTAATARAMLLDLRGSRLLLGWRGGPPAALDDAARVIAALSRLGASLAPWLESLEVNPLMVSPDGATVLDCLAVLQAPRTGS